MNCIRPSFLFPWLFREVMFKVPSEGKKLYLTFDDGPALEITSQVLSLLKEHHAKATFFLCGKQVEKEQQLFQQIIEEGHAVGHHTYHHLNGWKTKTIDYLTNVERAQILIQSRFFRPPYGKLTLRQYLYLRKKYHIVMWDVMCMDFNPDISPAECFHNIRQYATSGSIIVFHDSPKAATNMLHALEQTLIVFGKEGYQFDVITR